VEATAEVKRYVKKHHAAVHCSADLSLLERKLANCLLYKAYNDLLSKDYHEINIQEILKLLGIKTNHYEKLKGAIRNLMSTIIEWNIINKFPGNGDIGKETWGASTFLSSVQITGTEIKYEYSRTLRELLYRPSGYTLIKLTVQNKFKSVYGLILYENCLRYLNVGSTGWISITLFRKIMGVKDNQYKVFRDLSRRVLKPAVDEINRVSDISVKYEIKKVNNNPDRLKFIIQKLDDKFYIENNSIKNNSTKGEINNTIQKMLEIGISKKLATEWYSRYGEQYVVEKLDYVKKFPGRVKNICGLFRKAVEENYSIALFNNSPEHIDEKSQIYEKELQRKYQEYIDVLYRDWVEKLPSSLKEKLRFDLECYLENEGKMLPISRNALKILHNDLNFMNRGVFTSLKLFLKSMEIEVKRTKIYQPLDVPTFEEYSKSIT